jgi:hypothetical protein
MTATLDELSQAVLSWLDQRPSGFGRRSPAPTWGSKELRDTFRDNLETSLLATIAAGKLMDVIGRLADAFKLPAISGTVELHRWILAQYEGPHPETFDVMREEITQLLDRKSGQGIAGYQSDELANLIVQALSEALAEEIHRIPEDDITPEAVLHYYMIPLEIKRKYNVRTFLFFFGLVIVGAVIYGAIEPSAWLNPATSLFFLLGYMTLITTSLVFEQSDARPW